MSQTGNYNSFGPGLLIAKGIASGSQPIILGALQDIQLTFSAKVDQLMGQGQFSAGVGVGSRTIAGTAKIGAMSMPLYQLMFGGTPSTGTVKLAYAEAGTIPASTPFTVTVSNSATWTEDQGVVYTATGIPLTPVASSPTTGEYSVAAGVYTFAAADTGLAVQITYAYTSASTGATLVVANNLQGNQPVFGVLAQRSWNGTGERLVLPYCVATKIVLPTAQSKFGLGSIDFDAFSQGGTASPLTVYTDV
ncbi:MAG: hypothetical protein ACYCT1_15800 [Steroidobacteraceae bacterium]